MQVYVRKGVLLVCLTKSFIGGIDDVVEVAIDLLCKRLRSFATSRCAEVRRRRQRGQRDETISNGETTSCQSRRSMRRSLKSMGEFSTNFKLRGGTRGQKTWYSEGFRRRLDPQPK